MFFGVEGQGGERALCFSGWNAWEAPYILVELDVCLLWLALMLALPLAQLQQSAFSILRNTQ
jgi:hypothetical protein